MITEQTNREYVVQRKFKREHVSLQADILLKNRCFPSLVSNVSKSGLSILAYLGEDVKDLISNSSFTLDLRLPSGDMAHLYCRKVWVEHAIPPQIMTRRMGMEVLHPPREYLEFTQNQPNIHNLPPGKFSVLA
jgi:hypothetical protein